MTGAPDVAPDGSPVAFYRRLPATDEPELIHGLVPVGGGRWLDRPGWFVASPIRSRPA